MPLNGGSGMGQRRTALVKRAQTLLGGRIVNDVAYGIGDANLAELDKLDKGAVGLCPHDHKP